ncbi:glycosyltransferase family 25 protein [Rhizobium sp. PAMB 3182]
MTIEVINLKNSPERRDEMIRALDAFGLTYEFFEAIDGRTEEHPLFARYDPKLAEIRRGFPLTPGELGCYASHFLLWEKCARSGKPMLIFEDDVALHPNFPEALGFVAAHIDRYGLIRLSAHKARSFAILQHVADDMDFVRYRIGPHGTSCYGISASAASKLLRKAQVWFEPVDCHLDRFWTHGVGSHGLTPTPVVHTADSNQSSDIWQGEKRAAKSRRYRKLRALYRAADDIGRFACNLRHVGQWQPAEAVPPARQDQATNPGDAP